MAWAFLFLGIPIGVLLFIGTVLLLAKLTRNARLRRVRREHPALAQTLDGFCGELLHGHPATLAMSFCSSPSPQHVAEILRLAARYVEDSHEESLALAARFPEIREAPPG